MKQSIRFFSIGLLTASIVLFGFYYLLKDSNVSTKDVPLEDMVSEIESHGYRVITENEFISFTLNKENDSAKEEKDNKEDKQKKETTKKKSDNKKETTTTKKKKKKETKDKKDKVVKTKFTTKDGVVTQDIADILYEKKIIKNKKKFLDYLDDNDYSPYVQIGTFEVSSDMSMKELAEIITTYPGN